jgi:hypothetical protein
MRVKEQNRTFKEDVLTLVLCLQNMHDQIIKYEIITDEQIEKTHQATSNLSEWKITDKETEELIQDLIKIAMEQIQVNNKLKHEKETLWKEWVRGEKLKTINLNHTAGIRQH